MDEKQPVLVSAHKLHDSAITGRDDEEKKVIGRPFPKGVSGNPSGRPKRLPITEIYQSILDDTNNVEMIREAILKTLQASKMGAVLTLREMAERCEGKVKQGIDLTGEVAVMTLADRMERAHQHMLEREALEKQDKLLGDAQAPEAGTN